MIVLAVIGTVGTTFLSPPAGQVYDLSWLKLVRKSAGVVDGVEGLAEVVRGGVGGGDGLLAGLDLDLAVAAGGLDELPDRPAGSRLDPAADGEGGEHDVQVGVDGVALAVVDGPGLQVRLRHSEAFLDVPQLVAGADHVVGGDRLAVRGGGQVGLVPP